MVTTTHIIEQLSKFGKCPFYFLDIFVSLLDLPVSSTRFTVAVRGDQLREPASEYAVPSNECDKEPTHRLAEYLATRLIIDDGLHFFRRSVGFDCERIDGQKRSPVMVTPIAMTYQS